MTVKFSHRPATAPMGRFGGCWQLKVGIQASRSTVLISLLIAELKISFK